MTGLAFWAHILKNTWLQIDERNLGLIAAGVGFFAMLAVFPGIAAVIALWGFVSDPSVVAGQMELLRPLLPPDVFDLINGQVEGVIGQGRGTLGWASLLSVGFALWSARAGVGAMMRGMNEIYRKRNRSSLRHYFAASVMTLGLVGVSLVALAAIVVVPVAMNFVPLKVETASYINILRWMAALGALLAGIGMIYRYGPNRRGARPTMILPGVVLAVFLWGAVSAAFSTYLTNFGNYNEVYGSIGAVIALLVWLYLSAFLVLLGAVLNAEIERQLVARDMGKARRA